MKNSIDLMASLVKFTSRKPEESLVAKAKIIHFVEVNFGLVNVAEKEYAGKKVQQICRKSVMIVGLL